MKKIAFVFAVLVVSGCATQEFNLRGSAGFPTAEHAQPFFINGIGQTRYIDAANVCGGADRVARIAFEQSFLDLFVAGLTNGLYTPRKVSVYCVP